MGVTSVAGSNVVQGSGQILHTIVASTQCCGNIQRVTSHVETSAVEPSVAVSENEGDTKIFNILICNFCDLNFLFYKKEERRNDMKWKMMKTQRSTGKLFHPM